MQIANPVEEHLQNFAAANVTESKQNFAKFSLSPGQKRQECVQQNVSRPAAKLTSEGKRLPQDVLHLFSGAFSPDLFRGHDLLPLFENSECLDTWRGVSFLCGVVTFTSFFFFGRLGLLPRLLRKRQLPRSFCCSHCSLEVEDPRLRHVHRCRSSHAAGVAAAAQQHLHRPVLQQHRGSRAGASVAA